MEIHDANRSIRSVLVGSLCMLLAAVCWGGMFPVAKSALTHLDPTSSPRCAMA